MRTFRYSTIREQKWDSEMLGLIAAIYKESGKQELYLKQKPEELEKLIEIATGPSQKEPQKTSEVCSPKGFPNLACCFILRV